MCVKVKLTSEDLVEVQRKIDELKGKPYRIDEHGKRGRILGCMAEVAFEKRCRSGGQNFIRLDYKMYVEDYMGKRMKVEVKAEYIGGKGLNHLYPIKIYSECGTRWDDKKVSRDSIILFAWVNIEGKTVEFDEFIYGKELAISPNTLVIKKNKLSTVQGMFENGSLKEINPEAYGYIKNQGIGVVELVPNLKKEAWRINNGRDAEVLDLFKPRVLADVFK